MGEAVDKTSLETIKEATSFLQTEQAGFCIFFYSIKIN